MPSFVLVTGIMAAGKSTVAQLLAERLAPKSVHLRGDVFRRMIVSSRAEPGRALDAEARGQLRLRCAHLDRPLRADTPRLGHWVDSSAMSAPQTADYVLANLASARLPG